MSRSIIGTGKTIGRLLTPNGPFVACTPPLAVFLGKSGTIGVLIACTVPRGRLPLPNDDAGTGRLRPRLMDGGGAGALRRLFGLIGASKTVGGVMKFSSGGASPNN
jgi:hypothetical protein